MSSLFHDVKTSPQISRQGWIQDYPHPQNWLSVYWVCGSFSQRYGYCNLQLDELLHEADATVNFEEAIKKYKQAEDLLLNDVPAAMAYYEQSLYLVAPYVVGPRDFPSSSDGIWPGSYGPVNQYDINLNQVPSNYPKE
jgi:ABC-type oligopeptide transport system substrate-binding subunit